MFIKNKKAQVQMGENVIILFIFFILLIFSIVFYTKLQSANIERTAELRSDSEAVAISQKVLSLPELRCSTRGVLEEDCYDYVSVIAMSELLAANPDFADYYFNVFKYSTISIQEIFPEEGQNFIIYEKKNENLQAVVSSFSPIILCKYESSLEFASREIRTCNFGVLKVEVYS